MKRKEVGTFLLIFVSLVVISFVTIGIKNGINIGKAEAQPTGNILYVGELPYAGVKYK